MPDIMIVGAGIIGVTLALELRERGASVTVLDRSTPGQEASTAAAGMLAAADPQTPAALREFAMESARIYPAFVAKLEALTGLGTDFRRQGSIILSEIGEQEPVPSEYRHLTDAEIAAMEPALKSDGHTAYWMAEDSVDPALLMKSVLRAAEIAGVEIQSGVKVDDIRAYGTQVEVIGEQFRRAARTVVDCRGAWSGAPVVPRKGQMLYLTPQHAGLLQHVVRAPNAYIVPRSAGRILVGTTVEDAGFDKSVQPETIRRLHHSAAQYVPELATASVSESWAGLRPGTPDDLPVIGPKETTQTSSVFIASGHFRNGILLAPLTATTMANMIEGKPAGVDISAFAPSRFTATAVNKAS
jgi:glycine oxidase